MTTCTSCNQLRQTFINTPKGMICSQCFSILNPSDPIAMSLCDWFAGMAIQGVTESYGGGNHVSNAHLNNLATYVAKSAYAYADAMLAERAKTKP